MYPSKAARIPDYRIVRDAQTLREIVVVVPAHNERERLPACLASVAAAADQVGSR